MNSIGIDTQGLVDPPDREHLSECPLHEDFECPNGCIGGVLYDAMTGLIQTGFCDVAHDECTCLDLLYDVQADAADAARDEGLLYD